MSPCEPNANDPIDRAQMLAVSRGRPCRIVRLRLRIGRRGFVWELPGISHCLQVIGVGPREWRARISRLLWERIAGCPWILRLCTIGVHHNTFRDGDGLDPEYDLLFRGERV